MATLIDGYNLLHVTGIFGHGSQRGAFEQSRRALLDFLVTSMDEAECALTTVVFDSAEAPPGLLRQFQHHGLTIHYASGYESADELIEELIRRADAPRQLTVVSSDHRVQRAAKRRRARAIDSDLWYAEIRQRRNREPHAKSPTSQKPSAPLPDSEVAYWLEQFGDVAIHEAARRIDPPVRDARANASQRDKAREVADDISDLSNPFPPGYAEDLLDLE